MVTPKRGKPHSSPDHRRSWRLAAGCLISAGVVVALLRTVDVHEAMTAFLAFPTGDVFLVLVIYLVGLILKAERWKIILGPYYTRGRGPVYESLVEGFALNAVLPLHGGDLARALLVAGDRSASRSWAAVTLIIERVFDLGTIALLVIIAALTATAPGWISRPTVVLALGTLVASGILVIGWRVAVTAGLTPTSGLARLATWLLRSRLGARWNLHADLGQIGPSLEAMTTGRALITIGILSLAIWGLNALFLGATLQALTIQLSVPGLILLTGALALGLTAPASPGGIGVYQGIVVVVLGLFGVASDRALAAGIAAHVLSYVPVTLVGLILLLSKTARGTKNEDSATIVAPLVEGAVPRQGS